ncbi:MAG: hypothetical protein INR66_18705, partial [Gordonia polyisoprenivorans]|nr:hypothetical protein [Gordonia polyisoprenivorans]
MATTTGVDQTGTATDTERVEDVRAADEHALIMCGAEVFLPSGQRMKWPAPDSVQRLAGMIEWAWSQRPPEAPHKLLQPRGGCPQLWIVGEAALDRLGWLVDLPAGWEHLSDGERRDALAESVTALLTASLAPLLEAGWVLRGRDATPGAWIRLKKGSGLLDIVLEPYAWTAERIDKAGVLGIDDGDGDIGTGLGEDDASASAELGRRLAACVQHLDVLPSLSPARTGAAIADRIWNSRRKRGKGLVIDTPGPLPALEDGPAPHEDLEPPVVWTRHPEDLDVAGEVAPMVELVELDQRRAYLASTAIDLGYGTPKHVAGQAAAEAIGRGWAQSSPRTPFGIARVWLPAGEEIAAPDWLPLPHPMMAPDRRVLAWVTTRSVRGLCDPVASGGAGVELDDL